MKKSIILLSTIIGSAVYSYGQGALDAYNLSQPDLKGTARYMGMAGAFGALGGDLSAISQNPAGIGVYRSSDIGFTLDLDIQKSSTSNEGLSFADSQTKFLLNNIGAVLTLKLPSETVPNINFGFTYNKGASFNRVYSGYFGNLQNSMSNYIAQVAQDNGYIEDDLAYSEDGLYNPYIDSSIPWLPILAFNSYLITPYVDNKGQTSWNGLWDRNSMTGNNTAGTGRYWMQESGCTNDFNIVIGGNIKNVFYWGMNFDIVNINYKLNSLWGENLENALVPNGEIDENKNFVLERGKADWSLSNLYSVSGTGFNYQLGFILKPVQQLRLGFAFHTPTWYNLNEQFGSSVVYNIGKKFSGIEDDNDGYLGTNSYSLRTPWKIIASAAGVLGNNLIVSFDYEWANYGAMHISEPYNYGGYDGWYDDGYPYPYASPGNSMGPVINPNDPYGYENHDISTYYKSSNTFRVGVEFKPISSFSIRAGYANVSSPVKMAAKNNQEIIYTAGTQPSYRFDNNTNYITFGLGYRYQHVYVDLAYVYKHMSSAYHAYTPDPENPKIPSPQSNVSFTNNQIVLSAGYRF